MKIGPALVTHSALSPPSKGGVMKIWPQTGSLFIPISLRDFPPLAKGGSGGVGPAKPGASYTVRATGWTRGIAVDNRPTEVLVMPFARGGKEAPAAVWRATKTGVDRG
jgi:hypothetical protein